MPRSVNERSPSELHDDVFSKIPGAVDGTALLSHPEQQHLGTCSVCRAEVMQYRKVLRALHDLRTSVIHPAPGLLADVLGNIAEKGEQRAVRSIVTGRRMAYAGGLAVATVAGVTGAVLLAGRTKSKPAKKAA
jgi:predicted anti-sigma-YlaC factor YlaD